MPLTQMTQVNRLESRSLLSFSSPTLSSYFFSLLCIPHLIFHPILASNTVLTVLERLR